MPPLVTTSSTPAIAAAMQPTVKGCGRLLCVNHTAIAVIGVCSAMMIEACSGRVKVRPHHTSRLKPQKPIIPYTAAGRRRPP